jgi:hypothetical protein
MLFLDESGTGSIAQEPNFVLAGVIIDADKQWKAVENYLVALLNKHCPIPWGDRPVNFCFHASELYSGGKVFTRQAFSKEQRWAILDEIMSIPAKFGFPVLGYHIERAEVPDTTEAYRQCFMEAAATLEGYMRQLPDRDEVASIICEDLPDVRWWVQSVQRFQQHHLHTAALHAHHYDRLRLTRVIGQPHFEGKSPYSPLQLADACAFAIRSKMLKKPDADRFFDPLVPMMISAASPKPGGYEPGKSS